MRTTTSQTSAGSSRRWTAIAATGLLAVLLTGCGGSDGDATASDPAETSQAATTPAAAGDLPGWAPAILTDAGDDVVGFDFTDTPMPPDELLVHLITTGDGPPVASGATITADYLGEVYDGDEPFDSSFSTKPFEATIGVGQLIPGWDQALVGVPVGSRVLLSIPPDLGYGSTGAGAAIPPDSYLFFVIDVIKAA